MYENNLVEEESLDGDKARMLCIEEALVDLEHVNMEIENHMTKKSDRITLDREEVEFFETRRLSLTGQVEQRT